MYWGDTVPLVKFAADIFLFRQSKEVGHDFKENLSAFCQQQREKIAYCNRAIRQGQAVLCDNLPTRLGGDGNLIDTCRTGNLIDFFLVPCSNSLLLLAVTSCSLLGLC